MKYKLSASKKNKGRLEGRIAGEFSTATLRRLALSYISKSRQ